MHSRVAVCGLVMAAILAATGRAPGSGPPAVEPVGSFGQDSAGAERVLTGSLCLIQQATPCE